MTIILACRAVPGAAWEVVGVPVPVIAYGGGIHCITQQVPVAAE